MKVQTSSGIQAYMANLRKDSSANARSNAASTSNNSPRSSKSSTMVDKLTLSAAARELATNFSSETPSRTPEQEKLIAIASSDPKTANQMAHDLGHSPSRIFYDISHGDIRLSSTGEVPDENYASNFLKEASKVDAQKLEIYETEKAKGTDPIEIIKKIIDFKNSQSQAYREATAWGRV